LIGKVPAGSDLVDIAYDSVRSEVYATNFDNTNMTIPGNVFVISDSSTAFNSASPTVSEFGSLALPLVVIAMALVVLYAAVLRQVKLEKPKN
jgi:hypothetical protein